MEVWCSTKQSNSRCLHTLQSNMLRTNMPFTELSNLILHNDLNVAYARNFPILGYHNFDKLVFGYYNPLVQIHCSQRILCNPIRGSPTYFLCKVKRSWPDLRVGVAFGQQLFSAWVQGQEFYD